MRPRPDAAENAHVGGVAAHVFLASMRPRPDAAENASRSLSDWLAALASMRPRPDAAENGVMESQSYVEHELQ